MALTRPAIRPLGVKLGRRRISAIGQLMSNKQTLVGAACRSLRYQERTFHDLAVEFWNLDRASRDPSALAAGLMVVDPCHAWR
jgi:hypothetical protein